MKEKALELKGNLQQRWDQYVSLGQMPKLEILVVHQGKIGVFEWNGSLEEGITE